MSFNDALEWSSLQDNNLRQVRIRQSDDAVLEKVEVCFNQKTGQLDYSKFPLELPLIQGIWAIVAYEDEYTRSVVQGPVGIDRNCVDLPVKENERVSEISRSFNWNAFVITVAEEHDGQWVNTKTRGAYAGYFYEEDYDRHDGCPDSFISVSVNPANRLVVGLQGLFDEDGTPTGIDWILADTQCIAD